MSPARKGDELSLVAWAAELEAAAQIARALAGTAFMPDSHKRYHLDDHGQPLNGKDGRATRLDHETTTATAAAAIMRGWELGLPPGAALSSIAVINNTPALSALALRAVLQNAGHDIWIAESTATRAVVRARRAGTDDIQQSIWTLDRAKLLGLYPGTERSQWRRQPTAMLVARATSEAARWIAADAILGVPYIAEELLDQIGGEAEPLAIEPPPPAAVEGDGAKPKRRTTQRKTRAALPALPTGPPGPVVPAGEPERSDLTPPPEIPKAQFDAMHAGFRELGWDRAQALGHIAEWIARKIGKTADLTYPEMQTVLDNLTALRGIAAGHEPTGQAAADEPPPPDSEPPR